MLNNVCISVLDIGRGRVNALAEQEGLEVLTNFASITKSGEHNKMDKDPAIEAYRISGWDDVVGDWFVGDMLVNSPTALQYTTDSKTSVQARVLASVGLFKSLPYQQLPVMLKLVIGVPNEVYTEEVHADVVNTYKDKTLTITHLPTQRSKTVCIIDVTIYREGDASALHTLSANRSLQHTDFGIVNIGFKTTEMSVYREGFRKDVELSTHLNYGNFDILKEVVKNRKSKKLEQAMDISKNPQDNQEKGKQYAIASKLLQQRVSEKWLDVIGDIEVVLLGGTSLHLKTSWKTIPEPQYATVRGLYTFAKAKFGGIK